MRFEDLVREPLIVQHYPDPSGVQRPTSVAEKVVIPASELRLRPANCACGQQSTIEKSTLRGQSKQTFISRAGMNGVFAFRSGCSPRRKPR